MAFVTTPIFEQQRQRQLQGQQQRRSGQTSTYAGLERDPSRTAPSFDPLGRGGALGMRDVLERYFLPELRATRELGAPIQEAFLRQTLEPGALYGAASTAAQGYANQIFAPGGEVAGLVRQ